MRLMCADRDVLWADYDKALKEYVRLVSILANNQHPPETAERTREAHEAVHMRRELLNGHCRDHGCDPDWLKIASKVRR